MTATTLDRFLSHPDAIPRGKACLVEIFPDPDGGWLLVSTDDTGGHFATHPTKGAAIAAGLRLVDMFNAEMTIRNAPAEGWE